MFLWLCCSLGLGFTLPAHGQLTAEAVAAPIVPVHAPDTTAMAIHDPTGTLVVARQVVSEQLSVYALNEAGEVADAPSHLTLPKPEGVDRNVWVQDIAVHPTLPVVYVWQDLDKVKSDEPVMGPRTEFDHLIIYAIEGPGQLKQLGAFARGEAFVLGQTYASIGISGDGLRLFMPNLGSAVRNRGQIGYYDLNSSTGLPAKQPVPVPGSLDGYGLNQYEMAVRHETLDLHHFDRYLPAGLGWYAPTRDVANFGSENAFATWNTLNRRAALAVNLIRTMPDNIYLVGHPQAPMLYGVGIESDRVAYQQHAQGYPTLRPHARAYPGRRFRSEPIIIASPQRVLAVGGGGNVHLIALDDQWTPTDHIIDHPVDTEQVKAIVWSERFQKLYVPADNAPPSEAPTQAAKEGE